MTNTPSPTDEDRELIERLREADRNSVQRTLGSGIFGEAADRLESLLSDRVKLEEALRDATEALSCVDEEGAFLAMLRAQEALSGR